MGVSSREESDGEPPTEDGEEADWDSGEEEERFDGDLYTPPKLGHGVSSAFRRPREWLFLVEDRMLVAAGLSFVVLVLLTAIELSTGFFQQQLTPLFYVYGSIIGGNFTLITIVISISQLVISRQLGSPGDLRDRIEETSEYRNAVEEMIDRGVAPVIPTEFLRMLLQHTRMQLDRVDDELDDVAAPASEELEDLVYRLSTHIEHVTALLGKSGVGLFDALSVTLQTNYSKEIYEIRSLEAEYDDEYTDAVTEALDGLVERLEQIDVARQYLKTLYMQDELATMSRRLLYTGTPAVLSAIIMMYQFAASTHAILAPEMLSALVPVTLTLGVVPLTVLFAYVLRISVVSQRTVAITPFTTPTQEGTIDPSRLVSDEMAEGESGTDGARGRPSADD